jgi:hypothetical protein
MKFLNFFLFLWGFFALLDTDLHSQCRSAADQQKCGSMLIIYGSDIIRRDEATELPCDISLGTGIDHPVAVDGKVVVVLFLALLVRRHSEELGVKGMVANEC